MINYDIFIIIKHSNLIFTFVLFFYNLYKQHCNFDYTQNLLFKFCKIEKILLYFMTISNSFQYKITILQIIKLLISI